MRPGIPASGEASETVTGEPRGQHRQQDPPCDDGCPGANRPPRLACVACKHRPSLHSLPRASADRRTRGRKADTHPDTHTSLLGSRHPKTPHGRGWSPNCDAKPGKGHQGTVNSRHRIPQPHNNDPVRLGQAFHVALPQRHQAEALGHLLGTSAFQGSDQGCKSRACSTCVNNSKLWATRMSESHEG